MKNTTITNNLNANLKSKNYSHKREESFYDIDSCDVQKIFSNEISNFKSKSNIELHEKLKYLVRTERKILTSVLEYLLEVKKRRIYAELGYSSLFNYCIKELGYSESAALRRIQALKLMEEVPEIKGKISSGALNLSTVSMAQSFFQKEKKLAKAEETSSAHTTLFNLNSKENLSLTSPGVKVINEKLNLFCDINQPNFISQAKSKFEDKSDKLNFLKSIENKTTKEVQKELVKISPDAALAFESQKLLTENLTELKITLNQKQLNKLNRLKYLRSDLTSTAELLEWLVDQSLKKLDPMLSNVAKIKNNRTNQVDKNFIDSNSSKTTKTSTKSINNNIEKNNAQSYTTVTNVKRISFQNSSAQGHCSFVAQNGRPCLETHGLEIDHIIPKAKGGKNSIENYRLLCRTHNQFEAVRHFGLYHMQKYLK